MFGEHMAPPGRRPAEDGDTQQALAAVLPRLRALVAFADRAEAVILNLAAQLGSLSAAQMRKPTILHGESDTLPQVVGNVSVRLSSFFQLPHNSGSSATQSQSADDVRRRRNAGAVTSYDFARRLCLHSFECADLYRCWLAGDSALSVWMALGDSLAALLRMELIADQNDALAAGFAQYRRCGT